MKAVLDNLGAIGSGLLMTLAMFLGTMVLGTVGGVLVGLARGSKVKPISAVALFYTWFWRVLPVLLMLYFAFYSLPSIGLVMDPITAGIVTLGLATAAYVGEIVRGGMAAVPVDQKEAAASLGMSRTRTLRRVTLPYVIRSTAGPYISQAILALKGTSLLGIIGVSELTQVTRGLINTTYEVWPFLVANAGCYLVISFVLSTAQRLAEERSKW